ncbi:MAG: histidine phosphatase family protein [Vicinamibacterales bacterium]
MRVYLVHHGDAVGPGVDPLRPLSQPGREEAERLATEAATAGARPAVVWHSGKLRAKQTAEIFWRACNALAEFSATRDLQPEDNPEWMADRLRFEPRDIMLAGHFPHMPRLHARLMAKSGSLAEAFPLHGVVALETTDDGETWTEVWRLESRLG